MNFRVEKGLKQAMIFVTIASAAVPLLLNINLRVMTITHGKQNTQTVGKDRETTHTYQKTHKTQQINTKQ